MRETGRSVGVYQDQVPRHEVANRCSRLMRVDEGIRWYERSLTHAFGQLTFDDGRPVPSQGELSQLQPVEEN